MLDGFGSVGDPLSCDEWAALENGVESSARIKAKEILKANKAIGSTVSGQHWLNSDSNNSGEGTWELHVNGELTKGGGRRN